MTREEFEKKRKEAALSWNNNINIRTPEKMIKEHFWGRTDTDKSAIEGYDKLCDTVRELTGGKYDIVWVDNTHEFDELIKYLKGRYGELDDEAVIGQVQYTVVNDDEESDEPTLILLPYTTDTEAAADSVITAFADNEGFVDELDYSDEIAELAMEYQNALKYYDIELTADSDPFDDYGDEPEDDDDEDFDNLEDL